MTLCGWLLPSVRGCRLPVRADGGSCFILWDFRCEWKRGAALTCLADHAIITAGRDDAFVMASPLQGWMPPTSQRWMAAYFFFFLFFVSRPKRIAFKTREATITTTEIISKSDMISPPSTFVFRGEKPSAICFLPAGSPKAPSALYHKSTHASISVKRMGAFM